MTTDSVTRECRFEDMETVTCYEQESGSTVVSAVTGDPADLICADEMIPEAGDSVDSDAEYELIGEDRAGYLVDDSDHWF